MSDRLALLRGINVGGRNRVPMADLRDAFARGEGIDEVWQGEHAIYSSRLAARASGSRLRRITQVPEYAEMTIRSWSTTVRLRELMDARADRS